MAKYKKIIIAVGVAIVALLGLSQVPAETPLIGGISDFGSDAPATSFWRKQGNIVKIFPASTAVYTGALTVTGATSISGALTSGAMTQGGGIYASSTANAAETLPASYFDTENVLDYTVNGANNTLTLPASSTLTAFIPTAGQTRELLIRNATTTANVNITISAGAGMNLASSTQATIVGNTSGASYGLLKFIRKANTNIDVIMTTFVK